MLAIREAEIFRALKALDGIEFVLIGGYAVNAYILPRFSIDADLVVRSAKEAMRVSRKLEAIGYHKAESKELAPYHGEFLRHEKEAVKGFMVSVDLLIGKVVDRQTGASLSAEWVFDHSSLTLVRGKTVSETIHANIPTPDCLVVMKLLSCRGTDIRDVFMLLPQVKDFQFVRDEVSLRADSHKQFTKFKEKVLSPEFKNNLQGVYGFVDKTVFERHQKLAAQL